MCSPIYNKQTAGLVLSPPKELLHRASHTFQRLVAVDIFIDVSCIQNTISTPPQGMILEDIHPINDIAETCICSAVLLQTVPYKLCNVRTCEFLFGFITVICN